MSACDVFIDIPLTVQNSFAWSWSDEPAVISLSREEWTVRPPSFDNTIVRCIGFDISFWSVRNEDRPNPLPTGAWGRDWRFFVHSVNEGWQMVANVRIDQQSVWTDTISVSFSARDVTMIQLLPPTGQSGWFRDNYRITAIHRN